MATNEILVEKRDHIAIVTLNRPEAMNAMNPKMFEAVQVIGEELNRDEDVRAVILTGAGRGFCAGADIKNRDFSSNEGRVPQIYPDGGSPEAFRDIRKPTIAAVNGAAVGVGFAMALGCDMRVASENARFSTTFAKLGIPALDGVAWTLPRIVGEAKALELLYSAEMIGAREAERIGLVSYVTPPDQLMEKALELATTFAGGSPFANYLSKYLVREAKTKTYQEFLPLQYSASLNNRVYGSHDVQEAAAARRDKRPPAFKGVNMTRGDA